MKKLCFIFLAAVSGWLGAEDFTLLRDGKAQAVFVLPENASGNLKRHAGN